MSEYEKTEATVVTGQPVYATAQPVQPQQQYGTATATATATAQPVQQQQQQQQQQPILTTNVVVTSGVAPLIDSVLPVATQCPNCRQNIQTVQQYQFGMCAIITIIICFFLFWPLCFMPCCCPASFQDVIHICPLCRAVVGKRSAGGC